MKRTPTAEDLNLLRFAGILGHQFVLVGGHKGSRWVHAEQDDTSIDERYGPYVDPKIYEQVRFKTRRGRRWRRVR